MSKPDCEIVSIHGHNCDPRQAADSVVKLLENCLERARAGELVGVAIAGMHFDMSTMQACAGQCSTPATIGALFQLATRLANEN